MKITSWPGDPGPAEATSLFQIHHPGFYFGPEAALGRAELREILEAVADPAVLGLVRDTCRTAEPMFSHTSIFFNPEARPPEPRWAVRSFLRAGRPCIAAVYRFPW
jgi:hypothetical protein